MTRAKADIDAQRSTRRRALFKESLRDTASDLLLGLQIALAIYFSTRAAIMRTHDDEGIGALLALLVGAIFAMVAIVGLERRLRR